MRGRPLPLLYCMVLGREGKACPPLFFQCREQHISGSTRDGRLKIGEIMSASYEDNVTPRETYSKATRSFERRSPGRMIGISKQ